LKQQRKQSVSLHVPFRQNRAGTAVVAPAFFYAFQNIEENVQHQLQKLRTHPWIPESVAVRGFVYDVISGRLREIKNA
jgi:carbonic anhydrase